MVGQRRPRGRRRRGSSRGASVHARRPPAALQIGLKHDHAQKIVQHGQVMTAGEITQTLAVVGEASEDAGERVTIAGGCDLERGREFVDGQVVTLSLVAIDNDNN